MTANASGFVNDLVIALRALRRSPAFALVAVLTLALGIGASTAIFSIVDAVLLKPTGYDQPERLVVVWESSPTRNIPQMPASPANFLDWREGSRSFTILSGNRSRQAILTGEEVEPERVPGSFALADYFTMLGVRAHLGRTFVEGEDAPGAPPVVLIAWGLWQRRFGGDPGAIGRTLTVDGVDHEIVGILPEELPGQTQLWTPLQWSAQERAERGLRSFAAIGRLRPGVMVEQARAELESVAAQMATDNPATNEGFTVRVVPLMTALVGGTRTAVLALGGAVALVLLMACAIVANLLLARGLERDRELSVRAALGARGWQLARGVLAESAVLALAGGALGVGLAGAGVAVFRGAVPLGFPRGHQITVDGRLLLCALGLAVVSMMLVSLIPIVRALRPDLAGALRGSATGAGTGRGAHRIQGGLVVLQVALALLLIVGAGLLLQSFRTLSAVDPGFSRNPDTIVAQLLLPAARYPDAERRRGFVRELQDRLAASPGVTGVGLVSHLPLGGTPQYYFTIAGRPVANPTDRPAAFAISATHGWFETLQIPLRTGRTFTAQDDERGPPVVIIDETLANTYFPDQDPLGQFLLLSPEGGVQREIIGVVGALAQGGLTAEPNPTWYIPMAQSPGLNANVAVRMRGGTAAAIQAVRREVGALDPMLPVHQPQSLADRVDAVLGTQRFTTTLAALFGMAALALGALGMYGVLAYRVAGQTRELGVRLALGAQRDRILRQVLGQAVMLATTGVLIGLAVSIPLGRLLGSLLYEVEPGDPAIRIAATGVFLLAALAGALTPALRATRVDPLVAIRTD